ncbi:unnamed protein product [Allacma fusca]|uniref:Timeless N-terminal domain-containing protein n=1 Tax=Allacma fusca TaxID=39272 RepID=A0A8J2KQB9_9HEXA|nr:unnamed protein product [Allacma fusca]
MDPKLTADILATCNTIGYADEDKYYKDPECLASVKDLVLYLRRDDDDHSIRRLLGQSEIVHRDLLPLIKHYSTDVELYDVVLRLLVNLTNPALLVYEEEIPKNKTYRNYFHQITEHLQAYKQAFADELVWKRICERLKNLLALEWENRLENDKLTIERILILIRNVLQVPANPAEEKRNDDDASVHDQIVHAMHQADVLEVLLKMSSNSDSAHEYCLHIIEIISLMLREQTGEQLAKSNLERSLSEKLKDERELMEMRAKESVHKSIQMNKVSSRHSRFGGTFAVRDLKAPSGRDLLCHKPITSVADLSLDVGKKVKRTARNRLPMNEVDSTRRSTLSIRLTLRGFCERFLKTSYNFLMGLVKDRIDRSKTQDHDETYYLWAIKFFMEFNRLYKFQLRYVTETMSTGTFHYVQTLLDNYHEMMVTDKEKIPLWSKRAHSALRAYQELLYTLLWMDKCGTEAESSRAIKKNVFYLPEYRELCFSLLLNFNPVKFSKSYFYDLVETNHLFLRMLEDFASNPTEKKILVQVKRKKKPKRKAVAAKKPRRVRMNSVELEETWESISGEVSVAVLSTESPDESVNVIPFDAASDLTIDEQKPKVMERIATLLHMNKHVEAVTLLRNAREVWPDMLEDLEGVGMESDDVTALKAIYIAKSNGLTLPPEKDLTPGWISPMTRIDIGQKRCWAKVDIPILGCVINGQVSEEL